jgi:hypothetical protein
MTIYPDQPSVSGFVAFPPLQKGAAKIFKKIDRRAIFVEEFWRPR